MDRAKAKRSVGKWVAQEIIEKIIGRLPVKSLLRFKCVSKEWNYLISECCGGKARALFMYWEGRSPHPSLFAVQVNDFVAHEVVNPFQTFESSSTFLGNCNGFFLVRVCRDLYLWNPSTSWVRKVLQITFEGTYHDNMSGLWFDDTANDYKAIIFVETSKSYRSRKMRHYIFVGNIQSKKWTKLAFPNGKWDVQFARLGPVVKGNLHWKVRANHGSWSVRDICIVRFDPKNNDIGELPLPGRRFFNKGGRCVCLGKLDGCLSMTVVAPGELSFQVLVMREYGVKQSWEAIMSISLKVPYLLGPFFCSKSGDEYLFRDNAGLFAYNIETQRGRSIEPGWYETIGCGTYVECLEGV